jgi:signal transduction histidine kinase
MRKLKGIKGKIIVPMLLILFATFATSSYIIIFNEAGMAKNTIVESGESFSSLSVGTIIKNYLLYYESGFLKFSEIIDDLLALNSNVKQIQIIDINGKILFDSEELREGKYDDDSLGDRFTDEEVWIRAQQADVSTIEKTVPSNYVDIMQPYIEEWGRHEYSVRYIVSLSALSDMVFSSALIAVCNALMFMLISFILLYVLFNRFLIIPIRNLTNGVKMMGEGKLGYTVPITSMDELGSLASSFNQMSMDLKNSREQQEEYNKNLQQLVKQKNYFINQLGHDLKNPLNPLCNLLPLLSRDEKDPERQEIFKVIMRNVGYIKNLVIKTIELARLNSSKIDFTYEPLDLHDMVEAVIEKNKIMFETNDIFIENKTQLHVSIIADKLRFDELFDNLLNNAVKYSSKGGTIGISSENNGTEVTISIKDTGIGMTQDQISQIFNEFYKADASRHDFDSSGLGMSICKRIVEKHKGRIWVESEGLRKGTTVSFTLPIIEKQKTPSTVDLLCTP